MPRRDGGEYPGRKECIMYAITRRELIVIRDTLRINYEFMQKHRQYEMDLILPILNDCINNKAELIKIIED